MPGSIVLNESISFSEFLKIDEIAHEWREITKDLSVFFSPDFLRAVENASPSGMVNRYLLVYDGGLLTGVLSCQIKAFVASESIKFKPQTSVTGRLGNSIKRRFSKMISFEGIVCGSVLLTGNYAYHFQSSNSHKRNYLLAEEIMEAYRKHLNKGSHNIKVTFLKDFYEDKSFKKHSIDSSKYQEFSVQPNMILKLKPEWKDYSDYLQAFQSKYRVRAKRARKKLKGIELRELDYVDIKKYNKRIYELYRFIVDHINFNLFFLHEDYFAELKKNLKDKFRLFAYFDGDEMVAFYTCIDNVKEMNAHFLGYDPTYNRNHQLYLNSLYDMVDLSLKYEFETINFSRTAMEIKSSMGAEPYEMLCYLKHQNGVINNIVAKIVDTLNPTEEWVQRRPFK